MKRRDFLNMAGIAIPSFYILPRNVTGRKRITAPGDKLNIASIGAGGVCKYYIDSCNSENIIALCDVDDQRAAETYVAYPDARRYKDFRIMLEKEKSIDAVIVGTPDHTHVMAVLAALHMKKHVYCAKPLTHTIQESRFLVKAAKAAGVATQMSIQQNASDDHRVLCEMIWGGMIGEIREVHVWSNRPIWPQGIDRPKDTPPVPATLDWDLWIGCAPKRPYNPAYAPFNFRGWYDFGTGALGDMGCHQFDPIMKSLKLVQPLAVEGSSTKVFDETYPLGSIINYDFPERESMPAVRVTWYDGGLKPPRPEDLDNDLEWGEWNGGSLYVGSKGKIYCDAVGNKPVILPRKLRETVEIPKPYLTRSIGHYQEWIEACKGGQPAGAEFGYGAPLTEMVLLGNIAIRTGKRINWEYNNMHITGNEDANKLISKEYHNEWKLE